MGKRGKREHSAMFAILVLIVIVAFLILIFILDKKEVPNEGAECERDNDCVKVQTSCCPCSMGGEEACVQKAKEKEFKAKNCEENLMCIALYNCKIESCACRAGRCEAVPLQQ